MSVTGSYEKEKTTESIIVARKKNLILGAIIGDIIGSVYEFDNEKSTDIDLFCPESDFTDDSVLTLATMDCILHNSEYPRSYQMYGRRYPKRGYGSRFKVWLAQETLDAYGSFGNGSAMRVSPVGWAFNTIEEVLYEAKRSAEATHNHPEGIKGAQATASAVFLARNGKSKTEIKQYITETFHYNLDRRIADIRPGFRFDETCQATVPESIIAFLESTDFESAIRLAISLGGDSDTIACITGGIAEAFYKIIPEYIIERSLQVLPCEVIELVDEFSLKFKSE